MLWQNTKGSPQFVCLAPWHGLTESEHELFFREEPLPRLNRLRRFRLPTQRGTPPQRPQLS